jgi:hypothetical protein
MIRNMLIEVDSMTITLNVHILIEFLVTYEWTVNLWNVGT